MKYTIKALFTYVLRAVLHVFYLFPIKKNKILFLSFSGKAYACNPKYIYQYLRSQYGDAFKYIWILPENKDSEELSGCMIVPFKTLAFLPYDDGSGNCTKSGPRILSAVKKETNVYQYMAWRRRV